MKTNETDNTVNSSISLEIILSFNKRIVCINYI